jgi:UDP-2-acetamido-3-amino-2,3-dideoxy-glucuronate N-acetyltransferase
MNAEADENEVFVHPHGLCESDEVGRGTRIWAFAHVCRGAVIGEDCNIGDHACVEGGAKLGRGVVVKNHALIWDGVTVEDFAFIGPAVVFTNDRFPRSRHLPEAAARYREDSSWRIPTVVRRGATIGAGAVIVCGVTIGEYASVAAGAVVTRDVPAHALVAGNPARPLGRVCRCGVVLDSAGACGACGGTLPDAPKVETRSASTPRSSVMKSRPRFQADMGSAAETVDAAQQAWYC